MLWRAERPALLLSKFHLVAIEKSLLLLFSHCRVGWLWKVAVSGRLQGFDAGIEKSEGRRYRGMRRVEGI